MFAKFKNAMMSMQWLLVLGTVLADKNGDMHYQDAVTDRFAPGSTI